ncbi:hypothetical protein CLOP_g1363 [Closterium sp. NIES-67]|nr:hypothetical protein CLOP_g1363 [Closterium sp. NIES-67]
MPDAPPAKNAVIAQKPEAAGGGGEAKRVRNGKRERPSSANGAPVTNGKKNGKEPATTQKAAPGKTGELAATGTKGKAPSNKAQGKRPLEGSSAEGATTKAPATEHRSKTTKEPAIAKAQGAKGCDGAKQAAKQAATSPSSPSSSPACQSAQERSKILKTALLNMAKRQPKSPEVHFFLALHFLRDHLPAKALAAFEAAAAAVAALPEERISQARRDLHSAAHRHMAQCHLEMAMLAAPGAPSDADQLQHQHQHHIPIQQQQLAQHSKDADASARTVAAGQKQSSSKAQAKAQPTAQPKAQAKAQGKAPPKGRRGVQSTHKRKQEAESALEAPRAEHSMLRVAEGADASGKRRFGGAGEGGGLEGVDGEEGSERGRKRVRSALDMFAAVADLESRKEERKEEEGKRGFETSQTEVTFEASQFETAADTSIALDMFAAVADLELRKEERRKQEGQGQASAPAPIQTRSGLPKGEAEREEEEMEREEGGAGEQMGGEWMWSAVREESVEEDGREVDEEEEEEEEEEREEEGVVIRNVMRHLTLAAANDRSSAIAAATATAAAAAAAAAADGPGGVAADANGSAAHATGIPPAAASATAAAAAANHTEGQTVTDSVAGVGAALTSGEVEASGAGASGAPNDSGAPSAIVGVKTPLAEGGGMATLNQLAVTLLLYGRTEKALEVLSDQLALIGLSRSDGGGSPSTSATTPSVPFDTDSLANLAAALLHVGRYEEAAACLQAVLRREPQHPAALCSYSALLLATQCGHGRKVGRMQQQGRQQRQQRQHEEKEKDRALVVGADVTESAASEAAAAAAGVSAQQCAAAAVQLLPSCAFLWCNLAHAATRTGSWKHAATCMSQALKLQPSSTPLRFAAAAHRIASAAAAPLPLALATRLIRCSVEEVADLLGVPALAYGVNEVNGVNGVNGVNRLHHQRALAHVPKWMAWEVVAHAHAVIERRALEEFVTKRGEFVTEGEELVTVSGCAVKSENMEEAGVVEEEAKGEEPKGEEGCKEEEGGGGSGEVVDEELACVVVQAEELKLAAWQKQALTAAAGAGAGSGAHQLAVHALHSAIESRSFDVGVLLR